MSDVGSSPPRALTRTTAPAVTRQPTAIAAIAVRRDRRNRCGRPGFGADRGRGTVACPTSRGAGAWWKDAGCGRRGSAAGACRGRTGGAETGGGVAGGGWVDAGGEADSACGADKGGDDGVSGG